MPKSLRSHTLPCKNLTTQTATPLAGAQQEGIMQRETKVLISKFLRFAFISLLDIAQATFQSNTNFLLFILARSYGGCFTVLNKGYMVSLF